MSGALDGAVVAGVHGDRTDDVVRLAELLANALGKALVLTTAYEYEPAAFSPRAPVRAGNDERFAAAEAELEALQVHSTGIPCVERRLVPALGLAEALTEVARDVNAAALVVGGDHVGHVAQDLIGQAPCPVAVVPRGSSPEPLDMIGVAFDGSPGSHMAMTAALALAGSTGASVELLSAAPATGPTPADPLGLGRADRQAIRLEREAHTLMLADDSGASIRSRVVRGPTSRTLVAATSDLSLIVCGSHGRGAIERLVLGSTSSALIRYAFCPVLVVPPGLRRRPAGAGSPLMLQSP